MSHTPGTGWTSSYQATPTDQATQLAPTHPPGHITIKTPNPQGQPDTESQAGASTQASHPSHNNTAPPHSQPDTERRNGELRTAHCQLRTANGEQVASNWFVNHTERLSALGTNGR